MTGKKLFSLVFFINLLFTNQLNNLDFLEPIFMQSKETIMPYKTYDLTTSTIPFWKNSIMYNESIMFVGKSTPAPLLYAIKEIISITSYDGTTTYIEGVDYLLKEGKIYLTSKTKIPFFTVEEYYPEYEDSTTLKCSNPNHPYLKFSEGNFFQSHQVLVTYYHDEHSGSDIQESYHKKYDKFFNKLKSGQTTLLFYGDSITVGANASGFLNNKPYTQSWPQMVHSYLEKKYGIKINYVNTAVGGKDSFWGVENFQQNVIKYNPDFLVIAFGMNDYVGRDVFKDNIYKMIEAIKNVNDNIKILLVSTTLPNKEALGFYRVQNTYEMALNELSNAFSYIGLARMTSMHNFLLERKRFYDMTGNNVNHPNDFLTRVYCHTVLKAMLEDYL